jgi:catechol 2,3-dioxygenase-like lactoylglutathione lyase family enzyme
VELDGVRIEVADLGPAVAAYTTLLGGAPGPAVDVAFRFQLERGAIEIAPGMAGRRVLAFVGAPSGETFHGVDVRNAAPREPVPPIVGIAIDHVVVQTTDPERAIALWRDRLGLRLALDRAFPERGLRLVFLRSAGMTLEFAAGLPGGSADGPDRVHGVSYRVTDLAARCDRLLAAGVDVSAVRPGMRPGTSVATVRSGTAGVPTLLLQAET